MHRTAAVPGRKNHGSACGAEIDADLNRIRRFHKRFREDIWQDSGSLVSTGKGETYRKGIQYSRIPFFRGQNEIRPRSGRRKNRYGEGIGNMSIDKICMPVLKTERYRRPDGQGRNIMSVEMKDLTGCINPDKMHWKYAIKRQRDPESVRNVAGETGLILPETFEFQQSRFKERASLRQQTQGTAKGRGQRRKNCVRGNIGSVFR